MASNSDNKDQSSAPGAVAKSDPLAQVPPSVAGIRFEVKHTFGCNAVPRNFPDPIQSFAMTVGDKDYSDRLIYKVGKHLCVFNPENGDQQYFDRPKVVTDVLHFNISHNNRFISVCEIARNDRTNEVASHISIYYLVKFNRVKTLQHAMPRPYVCSTFCADGKMLAAITDDLDRHLVIWQWEKEKVYKTVSLSAYSGINLIRSAPSATLMLTSSGAGVLKNWCLASDGQLKPSNYLPAPKEASENFIDHVWLPSNMGVHKFVALADADGGHDHGPIKFRKQAVYIFEGHDNNHLPGAGPAAQSNLPIIMELRQVLTLKLDMGSRMEKIISSLKVFSMVGSMGLVGTYEKGDDKHEPYVESRRVSLGDKQLVGGTVYPSEEKMVIITRQGRLLNMPLDVTIEQIKMSSTNIDFDQEHAASNAIEDTGSVRSLDDDGSASRSTLSKRSAKAGHGITDVTPGGYHTTSILMADMAFERPLMVTIASDSTARVWNYRTKKCELTHRFVNDAPIAVAFHSSGFQLLVSFKDRIKMYNVLMDKLRPCREAIVKHSNCLKFSNGSQYFAAASAINVFIFETKSFTQLKQCMGHMNNVYQLSWAEGDQVLFSSGQDGNVYGWPVAKQGRIDFISGNRSSPSPVVALDVDAPSTVFPAALRDGDDDSTTGSMLSLGGGDAGGGGSLIGNALDRHNLLISTQDGNLRIAGWSLDSVTVKASAGQRPSATVNDSVFILPGEITSYITAMQLSVDRSKLFVGTSAGTLRVYPWPPIGLQPANSKPPPAAAKDGALVSSSATALSAAQAAAQLAAASQMPQFYEICTHSGPVVSIKVSTVDNIVVSAAADGSIFVHDIREDTGKDKDKNRTGGATAASNRSNQGGLLGTGGFESSLLGGSDGPEVTLNDDVVLMSIEDVEDHLSEVVALQKELNETKAKNDFHMRKVESDHTETLKKMVEMHDAAINKEKENFEKHRAQFEKRFSDLVSSVEAKDADNQKIRSELENKYEHKLADQLERYDTLSEKMQLLKQECQGLLEKHRNDFQKELNQVRIEGHNREKKLSNEQRRAVEDKRSNEDAFKEILRQQEHEYEDELKQMIDAANYELVSERDTILKLRTLVQTKNTKLDQMKKKLIEVSNASKARLVLLEKERAEKNKLKDTIEHYKDNLREREIALEEKEKIVLELRSTTRTLENFRFVLDHRLQQLSSERGPITTHIEGLEKHISTMYEELVEEFNAKKANLESSQLKDQKIHWITNDLNKTRQNVREKEQYITLFKRELNNIVSSMVVGKELEESVKLLYKKFVRGETGGKSIFKVSDHVTGKVEEALHGGDNDDQTVLSMESVGEKAKRNHHHGTGGGNGGGAGAVDSAMVKEVDEALVESAKEADRQKKFVERQANNLRHRLQCVKRETHTVARHRLNENSNLLFECNHLRTEVKDLSRKLAIKTSELDLANRNLELLRSEMRDSAVLKPLSKSSSRIRAAMSTPLPARPPSQPTSQRMKSPSRVASIDDLVAGITGIKPLVASPEDRRLAGNVMGTAANGTSHLVLSQSAPMLRADYLLDDESLKLAPAAQQQQSGGQMGQRSESHGVILQQQQSFDGIQHPSALAAEKSLRHISLNIPRAESMTANSSLMEKPSSVLGSAAALGKRKALPLGSGTIFAEKDAQLDRLGREVGKLAQQLDDSTRERELQRIELSRLRKQVMTMSTIHGQQQQQVNVAGTVVSSIGGAAGGGGLQLPSIANGSHSVALSLAGEDDYHNRQHGFIPYQQQTASTAAAYAVGLTNADLHGVPSEADKAAMRLAPAVTVAVAATDDSGGVNAPNSVASSISQQSAAVGAAATHNKKAGKGALAAKRSKKKVAGTAVAAAIPGVSMMASTGSINSGSV